MIDFRTLAEVEAEGFTHIKAVCGACSAVVQHPFNLIRRAKNVDDRTTLAELPSRAAETGHGRRAALLNG